MPHCSAPSPLRRALRALGYWGLGLAGLAGGSAAASSFLSLDQYGLEQGLNQNTVTSLAEDDRGFLWVGTQEGLHRFDGHRFQVFLLQAEDPQGLVSSSIDSLAIDPRSRLWVGSNDAGVQRWDLAAGSRTHAGAIGGLSHPTIAGMVLDGAAGLWLRTPAGIDYLGADLGPAHPVLDAANLVALAAADEGAVALDRLCRAWRLDRREARELALGLPAGLQCHALQVDGGQFWIAAGDGALYRVDTAAGALDRHALPATTAAATALIKLRTGRWLVGFAHGQLATLDPGQTQLQPLLLERPIEGAINTLYQSRSDVIWIGTQTRGLFRARPLSHAIRRDLIGDQEQRGWPSRSLRAIWSSQGQTLIGSDAGLLRRPRPDAPWQRVDSIPAVSVRVIETDPAGGWWVGTHAGLWKLDPDLSAREIPGLPHPRVSALSLGPDGLWVATRGGLTQLREGRLRNDAVPVELRDLFLTSLLRDAGQQLWIGSNERGLFRLDPDGSLRRYSREDGSLGQDSVWSLHADADAIWAGTFSGGLQRIDRRSGEVRVYHRGNGLSNDVVYRIESDPLGRLWLSTNNGLSVLDPGSGQVQVLQPSDGLRNHEYNAGASLRDADGLLYFGGIDGLDVIDPRALDAVSQPAIPVVTGLRVIGRERRQDRPPLPSTTAIAYADALEFDYRDRVIAFDLAAIDFSAPDSARLRYRLRGASEDWVEPGRAHAELLLSYLAPGAYELEIEAAGRDGRFTGRRTLQLTLQAPPWRQPAAYLAYSVLGLLLLAALLLQQRRRARGKREQIELLNRIVAERTAALELLNQRLLDSNAQLQQATRTDPLTQVANRRELQDWLQRERALSAAAGGTTPLLFCMIDIDDFKQINDRHGHAAGDEVLVAVADRLRRICREHDLLVRWGGEEFLLVFRGAPPSEIERLGGRICHSVADGAIVLGNSLPLTVTCSVGFAPWPFLPSQPALGSWQRSVALADHALYQAKARGKHGWVAWLPAPDAPPDEIRRLLEDALEDPLPQAALLQRSAGPLPRG